MSAPELERLIAVVQAKLLALPSFSAGPNAPYTEHLKSARQYHDAAKEALQTLVDEERAKVVRTGHDIRLKLADVTTTCTAGEAGLMANWISAARKRLVAEFDA